MSKFLSQVRSADNGTCVNEHEIFEMMRSRKLYQIQFDLHRKLQKRIRAIELDAKVKASAFEMKRIFFLNKMQEKVRQRNALNEKYTKIKQANNLTQEINENHTAEDRPETSMQLLETVIPEGEKPTSIQNPQSHSDGILPSSTKDEELFRKRKSSVDMEISNMVRSRTAFSLGGLVLEASRNTLKQRRLKSETCVSKLQNNNKMSYCRRNKTRNDPNIRNDHRLPEIINNSENLSMARKTLKHCVPSSMENEEFRERRSLASYEVGATTPGGKLLLFKEDHDEFLDKFRQKKERQLLCCRRRSENLDQKIKQFNRKKSEVQRKEELTSPL